MQAVIDYDNSLGLPLESSAEMAKPTTDGLSKEIKGLYAAAGFLALWLGGISYALYVQYGDLSKIKQDISDHGLGQIVSELEAPKSPEQLQANLTTVVAQVETARVRNQRPSPQKVQMLSGAVAEVAQKNPDLPEVWQAAAQLISFRAPLESAPTPRCFSATVHNLVQQEPPQPPNNASGLELTILEESDDCTFDLGDAGAIVSRDRKIIDDAIKRASPKPVLLAFGFRRAHIIYRGSPLPPEVKLYMFENCTFDWSVSSEAPKPAQKMTVDLLQAENLSNVRISGL